MKKRWAIIAMLFMLAGCTADDTFETISDEAVEPVMAAPGETTVMLPDGAAAPVLQSDDRQMYLGEDYHIVLENHPSGDLGKTIRAMSGFEGSSLTVMKTVQGLADRYEFVWVSAAESGEQLGRGVILDDGQYHYCMSVLRDPQSADNVWEQVFASFRLV